MIEMPKQRLERIAAQMLAGMAANSHLAATVTNRYAYVKSAIDVAAELIKQIDERSPQA